MTDFYAIHFNEKNGTAVKQISGLSRDMVIIEADLEAKKNPHLRISVTSSVGFLNRPGVPSSEPEEW
jgi:hypothetical protein